MCWTADTSARAPRAGPKRRQREKSDMPRRSGGKTRRGPLVNGSALRAKGHRAPRSQTLELSMPLRPPKSRRPNEIRRNLTVSQLQKHQILAVCAGSTFVVAAAQSLARLNSVENGLSCRPQHGLSFKSAGRGTVPPFVPSGRTTGFGCRTQILSRRVCCWSSRMFRCRVPAPPVSSRLAPRGL